jgi:hypothetical protein
MIRRYLAFDIETAKILPEQVTNLLEHRPLGICCAAAVASDRRDPAVWHGRLPDGSTAPSMSGAEARTLVHDLQDFVNEGYTLLTWNGLGFDLDVLAEESGLVPDCARLAAAHVDMMFHVVCALGHRLSLDSAARGMGLEGKTPGMTGYQAPILWAQGSHAQAIEYNVRDARITLALAGACESSRALRWITRRGGLGSLPLPDGWLEVKRARLLPQPDTSWMADPPRREDFFRWFPPEQRG